MPLNNKQLGSISEADLDALVTDRESEGKFIEYKEAQIGNSDSDKKEFLRDVTSLANALGGDLIIGIKEAAGVAAEVVGLQIDNVDNEKLRLENIIRVGIRPRIQGVTVKPVQLQNKGVAIVIRVPNSWIAPHQVVFQGEFRFYTRNSAGKYALDVDDLRTAFELSGSLPERIRNLRVERLSKIVASDIPVPLHDAPKVVLHLVPFNAFDPTFQLSAEELSSNTGTFSRLLSPPSQLSEYRFNLDGYVRYGHLFDDSTNHSYIQFFRNGIVEVVDINPIALKGPQAGYVSREFLIAAHQGYQGEGDIEVAIANFLTQITPAMRTFGSQPPIVVMLTLLGVRGFRIGTSNARRDHYTQSIDRDDLILPEILVQDFSANPTEYMKPAYDAMWNAAGWPRSMNYDDAGNRIAG